MKIMAGGVVNLGPQLAVPGTFVWKGDEFQARRNQLVKSAPAVNFIDGEILQKNGRVVEMDISRSATIYRYEYNSSMNRPPWFPSRVTTLIHGKCIDVKIIKKVAFANAEGIAGEFLPQYHLNSSVEILTVVSKGTVVTRPAASP